MADKGHLEILAQGVEAWDSWRERNPSMKPDFSDACLTGVNLEKANLTDACLTEASLFGMDLTYADLSGADLSDARFHNVRLTGANLSGAHLSGAYLSGASLIDVRLTGANLMEASLSGADLSGADLSGADLSEAKLSEANLAEADLMKASLFGADLTIADLSDANLMKASLTDARLTGANLTDADIMEASVSRADLSDADLTDANLSDADLSRSNLVKTNLTRTTLTGCRIYGISAWSLNLKGAKQWNLNVSDVNEPAVMVDDLEVAQFIYLLLNYKKLRNVLNAITERGVLILGRFGGGGLEVLEAIAAKLRESNYQPFIFDFDRPAERNYTETVKTLVGLSRFVIVDLSGPSVPQELYATVPHFKIPFVPIVEEGRRQYSMAVDILEYPWVVDPPVRFVDVKDLVSELPTKIIAPAENLVKDRQARLAELFDR